MVRYEFYKSQNYNHFSIHLYHFLLVNFTHVIFLLACHNGIQLWGILEYPAYYLLEQ